MFEIKIKHIAIMILSMVMQSCYYVEFFEPYDVKDVHVGFEWESGDSIPKSMRVVIYPADEITYERMKQGYSIFDMYSQGRKIQLPIGLYNVVSFNTDTDNTLVSGYGSPEALTAITTEFPLHSSKGYSFLLDSLFWGLPIKNYPSYMVASDIRTFRVNPTDNDSLIMRNLPIVKNVKVKVSSIKGMQTLQQVMLSIAPLPSSTKITDSSLSEHDCVFLSEATAYTKENTVTSSFNIFEHSKTKGNDINHRIVLMFWLNEGNIYIPLDIGSLHKYYIPEQDIYYIDIKSLDIDLKDYVVKQDGFDISVEEWGDVNIDINI